MTDQFSVYAVDDNDAQLRLVASYLDDTGYRLLTFNSARDFLAGTSEAPGCILLDNMMPDLSGLEIQSTLIQRYPTLPIIYISGESTYEEVFTATRNGAYAFLQKPFTKQKLRDVVAQALERSTSLMRQDDSSSRHQTLFKRLTDREKEVFRMLVDGKHNKMISRDLGISLRTAEFHRANIQKKLHANQLSDLIAVAKSLA